MILPDDFGLSPVQTLAHVGEHSRAPQHGHFWKNWTTTVLAESPRLSPIDPRQPDPADPSGTHWFEGIRHVRVGCSLVTPPKGTPLRAGLVACHGYAQVPRLAQEAETWQTVASRGVAVLVFRARGFPGSQIDAGDWSAREGGFAGGWITRGLGEAVAKTGLGTEWSFSYGVADAFHAAGALRRHLETRAGASGETLPIFMHGQSFGGALAVMAASLMPDGREISRLAIGLPTLGDWPWRLAHRTAGAAASPGAGGEILRLLRDRPGLEETAVNTLRLFDIVIHAHRVRCPALCKLATRDEAVPAPSAAAVFNNLSSDPGLKWRFVTTYGHFDGGIADGRRHAMFERARDDFLDPTRDPTQAMAAWDGVMHAGNVHPGWHSGPRG